MFDMAGIVPGVITIRLMEYALSADSCMRGRMARRLLGGDSLSEMIVNGLVEELGVRSRHAVGSDYSLGSIGEQ